jgi:hypothetical protein
MKLVKDQKWVFYISTFVFLSSIFLSTSVQHRADFIHYFIPFAVAFVSYLWISFRYTFKINEIILLISLAFISASFFQPVLSNDYYRFLWDGELFWHGIDPYKETPITLSKGSFLPDTAYFSSLYKGMGELSSNNFSCYTPLNQVYFIYSTAFSDSVVLNSMILRILIVGTQLIGVLYLIKLLAFLKFDPNKVLMVFLNPLVIFETAGNLHFEGVMLSFMIIGFYFLISQQLLKGAFFFTLAIQIKLVPLILLPFLWRYLGWRKALIVYLITLLLSVVIFSSVILSNDSLNVLRSILLYFQVFEFNSSVIRILLEYDPLKISWYKVRFYSPRLSLITFISIIFLSLRGSFKDNKHFYLKMAIAYTIYLLLSSTVHPWYLIPLLFLSIMADLSFGILWSFGIFLTYSFYGQDNVAQSNWLIWMEYIPVLMLFVYEIWKGGLISSFRSFPRFT